MIKSWRAAVVVLLLCLAPAIPDRTNEYDIDDSDGRRSETQERPVSGRRWTTSRNSPYQKIVSSYEQDTQEEDRAKAKSIKRKPLRTTVTTRDQIASETTTDDASEKVGTESNSTGTEDTHTEQKITTLVSRRRSSSKIVREPKDDSMATSNSNKRRRIVITTLPPHTMSDSLYQYFRPLDSDVPQDDIIPFLDFGRKLLPAVHTSTIGTNSIDIRSSLSKVRYRHQQDNKKYQSSDEDILQEDMDVTIVKKNIERNSVPRGKLRLREQGISEFYKKRDPFQGRTTENLVSTDSSTMFPQTDFKHTTVLKKINSHQIQLATIKPLEKEGHSSTEKPHITNNVDILDNIHVYSRPNTTKPRPNQSLLPITLEVANSPLTAESTLVKTIIKEVPRQEDEKYDQESTMSSIPETSTVTSQNPSTNPQTLDSVHQTVVEQKHFEGSKSKQEYLETAEITKTTQYTSATPPPTLEPNISPLQLEVPKNTKDSMAQWNRTTNKTSSVVLNTTTTGSEVIRNTTIKLDTTLRSQDIYKPKIIPPGSAIPQLPRVIPTNFIPRGIATNRITSVLTSTIMPITFETSSTRRLTELPTSTKLATEPPPISIQNVVFTSVTTSLPTTAVSQQAQVTITTDVLVEHRIHDDAGPESEVSTPNTVLIDTYELSLVTTNNYEDHLLLEDESPKDSFKEVEDESVPPPSHEEYTEPNTAPLHQYHAYITIPPTTMILVDDAKTGAETQVLEKKNVSSTTFQPVEDWVKLRAVEKEVDIINPQSIRLTTYLLVALGIVPVVLGSLLGARFIVIRNREKVLDESEYSSEYNRSPLSITNTPIPTKLPRIPTHVGWSEAEKPPSNGPTLADPHSGRWEFPRKKLRLQTLLGQGNFGQVWKAEADDISGHEGLTRLVAVKTVKESANTRGREDLLRELGIMQELGSHPNVVTLLGCCTEKEPIYVVMEYVMYGKLLSFLRDHRTRAHYYNFSDAMDALTSRDLTVFAYCVARGMDYLSNKNIIHRDLAARNVLVDHNKLCKIADFGMSRNVRDTGQIYEQRQSKGALPIRWMAPESLHFSLYTHTTDVWSFGILMWEIVTLGSTPYSTMGAREVMRRVRDGYRLDRPSHCHQELFSVIDKCWHSEPSKRPSFAELKVELARLLSDTERHGSYVDLDSYADQMRRRHAE